VNDTVVSGMLPSFQKRHFAPLRRRAARLRALSQAGDVRVPETRFGPLERVLAGSLGDDFMLLLAV
jgi:hypothetical protein